MEAIDQYPFVDNIKDYEYGVKEKNDIIQHALAEEKKVEQDDSLGVDAQVCATIYPQIYPGYDNGECSIHYQYYRAFYNAKQSIYIESQHPGDAYLLKLMKWKLQTIKDFKIIFIVPIRMMHPIVKAKKEALRYMEQVKNDKNASPPRYYPVFSTLASLKQFDNFCLSGMYKSTQVTEQKVWYDTIYVHSKLCIVDGQWFTIGSANFVDISFIHDHSELNVCVFDKMESMKLLRKLANKHCEQDDTFDKMDDVQIIDYMIKMARSNLKRRASQKVLDGRLYALDPESYASD